MAIEAVKIPQNVYVEDRIIGPVTLKQLMITGLGCGVSYVIFAIVTKSGYNSIPIIVICWIPAVIAAAFAFMKVNDLSLFNIILLMIEGFSKPNIRYWSPHAGISINLITRQSAKEIVDANAKVANDIARLAEVTRLLEKRQEDMEKLTTHDAQRPQNVEAVRTKFQSATSPRTESALAGNEEPETSATTLSVNPDRVKAGNLEQQRSIDSIGKDIKAYDQLTAHTA